MMRMMLSMIRWSGGKKMGAKYPYVVNIACKYLAIPATSTPSD
jgi:hypothetical protein